MAYINTGNLPWNPIQKATGPAKATYSPFLNRCASEGISAQDLEAIVRGAVGSDCSVSEAEAIATNMLRARRALPYDPKGGSLHSSFIDVAYVPMPIALTSGHLVTRKAYAYAQESPALALKNHVFPIPSISDIGTPALTAIGNASAGTGVIGTQALADLYDTGDDWNSFDIQVPVIGWMFFINWSASDLGDELRVTETTNSTLLATVRTSSDDCTQTVLYSPAATTLGTKVGGGFVFANQPTGTDLTLRFQIYKNGAAETALGGLTIDVVPFLATQESLGSLIPTDVSNGATVKYARP
jgi:hypothetical protein